MNKTIPLLLTAFTFFISVAYAQKGKDGVKTVAAASTIVNEYTALTSDATTGATSVTVSNSALNTNGRFTGSLAAGDLIMIVQMQGATIDGSPADSTWGAITGYNNAGQNEFAEVAAVPNGSTINLSAALKNNYTASGKVQVVRVPRYATLTINSAGILACDSWNGVIGGVLAVEVQGNTVMNAGGTIDASATGFRGGAVNNAFSAERFFKVVSGSINDAGEKGESIAGFEADYNAYGGMFGRGAPANGGGGGDAWNAAGGGGANAGDITKWNGDGSPDITTNASYITAWNQEGAGFANTTSSGGGRGGYAVAEVAQNPLQIGPGNVLWDPNFFRDNVGGFGGRPLDYSTGRLFLGGGGGAGHSDNGNGGGGGNGGGLIYLLSYGTISGSGSITSNGQKGFDDNSGSGSGDGMGGGGAGGSIILNSTGCITGISISANGGAGGNQFITIIEAEGPGGGGGGGYIDISNGTVTTAVLGGANGTTDCSIMTLFPPDGATIGGAGIINTVSSSSLIDAGKDVTICNGQSTQLKATGGNPTDTYLWTPSLGLDSTNVTDPLATPPATTTYYISVSNGGCQNKDSVVVTVIPKVVLTALPEDSICPSQPVTLNTAASLSYTYSWSPSSGLNCTGCNSPVASPSVTTTYTVIATNQYCSDTTTQLVKVLPFPNLITSDATVCFGQATQLRDSSNGILTWSPATDLSCSVCNNPQITALSNTTYTLTATLGTCTTTETINISVDQPVVFAGVDTVIFSGQEAVLHGSGAEQFQWLPSGSLSASNVQNPIASPSNSTTYTLVGFDSFGCSASSSVVVFVNNPCDIPVLPNAFSPNGDGKNDIYKMINPFVDKLLIFSIYNRWGQLVFETGDLNIGWDGKFNGQPEPVGTYAYYLKVICQGNNLIYKGNVTLIR